MDRDELKKLEAKAAPGPWREDEGDIVDAEGHSIVYVEPWDSEDGVDVDFQQNTAFIVAARSAVPELLAENERLQAERDKLQRDLNHAAYERDLARRGRDRAQQEAQRLREAVAFARSVIKSGEDWTETCEQMLALEGNDQ